MKEDQKVPMQTMAAGVGRISALAAAQPRSKQRATTADLAFVDAAIALQRAGMAQVGQGAVDVTGPIACDPVDVAAAVVAVAVLAYHVYNSCLIGGDSEFLELAGRLNIAPTVSLEKMIEARNQLAGSLGVERML